MSLTELLTAIANAIRTKKGTTATINAQNFPSEILSILKGSGNAKSSDVLSGKTFTNDSGEQTGTIPIRENGTNTISSGKDNSGIWFYIPYGYYPEYSDGKAWVTSDPSQYGNAGASDVLSGKTFTSSNGLKIEGTMPNAIFKNDNRGIGSNTGWTYHTWDLGASCRAGSVTVTSSIEGYNNASYKEEIIKVSNDNSNWIEKLHIKHNPRDSGGNTSNTVRVDGYRYIRYEICYNNANIRVANVAYSAMI